MQAEFCPGWVRNGLTVHPFFRYSCGGHYMMLNPECGSTLFLDDALMETLRTENPSENLAFLLVQRGLASYDNSRSPICVSHPRYPHFFMLDLTQNCNLHCRYCFRELSRQSTGMEDDMLLTACRELAEYWRRHPEIKLHIQAWGGEPLLRVEQIARIRRFFDEQGMDPCMEIETNGTLIDDRIAELLWKLRVHVGVSVDGDPAVQDAQRPDAGGNPTSGRVEAGVRSLRKFYGDQFGSITVVTRNTAARLPQILDYFVHTLHLTGMKFNPLREVRDRETPALDREALSAFYRQLLAELIRYVKSGTKLVEQNICQRLRNLLYRPCDNICNACGCQGGYAMVTIDHRGDVYPCEMSDFPEMKLGTIGAASIEAMTDISAEGPNAYFAPRHFARCAGCPWRFFCRGGCKSASIFSCGNTQALDETECTVNRTLYPLLVQLLMEEPEIAEKLMGND